MHQESVRAARPSSPCRLRGLFAVTALFLAPLAVLAQDVVILKDGREVRGTVQQENISLDTADGRLVVPVGSVVSIEFDASRTAKVKLLDGTELNGQLQADEVWLSQDLYSTVLPVDQIRSVIVRRSSGADEAVGLRVPLEFADTITSTRARLRPEVLFCVAEDVVSEEQTLLFERGAPAWGEIVGVRGADSLAAEGSAGIDLDVVIARDGVPAPIRAGEEYARDGARIPLRALGVRDWGDAAEILPGAHVEAVVASSAGSGARGDEQRAASGREHCREYLRFEGQQEVRLEDVVRGQAYAPFPPALTLSIPVRDAFRDGDVELPTQNLWVFDTSVWDVRLDTRESGDRVRISATLTLRVTESHDKLVNVALRVTRNGQTLVEDAKERVQAEEEELKQVRLTVVLDGDTFMRAEELGDELRLAIDLQVFE